MHFEKKLRLLQLYVSVKREEKKKIEKKHS